MHLIDVRDVYKIYNPGENQVNALDGVSLTIDEGEFVAIIGQSGSGKSTLMNMLGLLDVPTSGEYYINGNLVEDLTDDQMSVIRNEQIGFIFQGFNLISSPTAVENVELPLVYRGMGRQERREIAEKALARVGLDKRMHHLPAEMSGGQQQRGPWLAPLPQRLRSFWPMSPPATWTPNPPKRLWRFCTDSRTRAAPWWSSPMIMRSPWRRSGWCVSVTARSWRTTSIPALRKNTAASPKGQRQPH